MAEFDLSLTGFNEKEIDALTLEANLPEDEVPPVPATPTSQLGDLWICGPHRVLCGDCTNADDVARRGMWGRYEQAFGESARELQMPTVMSLDDLLL